jgi:hypothetical protein
LKSQQIGRRFFFSNLWPIPNARGANVGLGFISSNKLPASLQFHSSASFVSISRQWSSFGFIIFVIGLIVLKEALPTLGSFGTYGTYGGLLFLELRFILFTTIAVLTLISTT